MRITAAATVMPVRDLDASLRFYTEVLGFRLNFRVEKTYAGVELQGCLIHLSHQSNPNTASPGSGGVYVFCDEVDGYYSEITARGAKVDAPPRDYPYGMRDFAVIDPDENKVSFGCPIKQT